MTPASQARGAGSHPLTALLGVELLGQQFEQSAVGAQRRGNSSFLGRAGDVSWRR